MQRGKPGSEFQTEIGSQDIYFVPALIYLITPHNSSVGQERSSCEATFTQMSSVPAFKHQPLRPFETLSGTNSHENW